MSKRFKIVVAIILILVIGGYLRFANLTQRGIFSWDEGHYVGVLYTLSAGIKYIFRVFVLGENLGKFSDYMLTYGVNHYLAAKPTFFVLGLIAALFTGLKIYTLQIVSATMGLLTVLVIYFIARVFNGIKTALMAAIFMATSFFHSYYSRAALPQITSVFFIYLAILFYSHSIHKLKENLKLVWHDKYLLLSGVTVGIAFSCHYNLFWAPFIFWCAELIYYKSALKNGHFMSKLKRFVAFSLYMAAPLIFYEVALRILKVYIYRHPSWIIAISGSSSRGEFFTYFEQIKWQILQSKHFTGAVNNPANKFFCMYMIFLKENLIVSFLFIIGICNMLYLSARKRFFMSGYIVILAFFAVPLALYAGMDHIQNMRSIAVVVPAYCLIAAGGFNFLSDILIQKQRFLAGVFFVIFVSVSVILIASKQSKEYLNQKAGYEAAVNFMKTHEGLKHFSSNPIITRIYAGRKNVYDIRSYYPSGREDNAPGNFSLDHVIMLYNKGFRYLVLDHLRYRYSNALVSAAENISPVFSAFHSSDADMFEQGYEGIKYAKACPKKIEVYRVEDLLNQISISKKQETPIK